MKVKGKGFKRYVDNLWISVDNFIWLFWSQKNKGRWKVLIFIILSFLYWFNEIKNGVNKIFE